MSKDFSGTVNGAGGVAIRADNGVLAINGVNVANGALINYATGVFLVRDLGATGADDANAALFQGNAGNIFVSSDNGVVTVDGVHAAADQVFISLNNGAPVIEGLPVANGAEVGALVMDGAVALASGVLAFDDAGNGNVVLNLANGAVASGAELKMSGSDAFAYAHQAKVILAGAELTVNGAGANGAENAALVGQAIPEEGSEA